MEQQFWGPGGTWQKVAALQFGKSHDNTHNFTPSAKVIGPTGPKALTVSGPRENTTGGPRLKGKHHQ